MNFLASKVEFSIMALVLIALIVSGSVLWYSLSILERLDKLTSNMSDLTSSLIDLAGTTSNVAEKVGASLDAINDIQNRLGEVESRLTPTITVIGPWSGAEMDKFLPVLDRFEALTGINVRYKKNA